MGDVVKGPVHYGHNTHSGLVTLLCTTAITEESWVNLTHKSYADLRLRDDGMLYTHEIKQVTCPQCLRVCPKRPVVGAKYRHFKGHVYTVTAIVKHSETLEELVVYADNKTAWAWPIKMFSEFSSRDGVPVLRFQIIEDDVGIEQPT